MVSTDYDLQLQQRRQESRAFILRASTPIATALGEGYEVELPQDIMHEGTGYIIMPDGKRLIFNYEKLNAGRGQFDVRGDLTVENISLHNHLPHGKHNPHINVTVTRPSVDIARDIKRRLLPITKLLCSPRWNTGATQKRNNVTLCLRAQNISRPRAACFEAPRTIAKASTPRSSISPVIAATLASCPAPLPFTRTMPSLTVSATYPPLRRCKSSSC
jgi:hypothetical protein